MRGNFRRFLLVIPLALVSVAVSARGSAMDAARGELSVTDCVRVVSRQFDIDPLPIELLLDVEGGRVGTVRRNDNGSEDLGPMQINSIHLPELALIGISRDDIRDNRRCRNVFAGVLLYVRHLNAAGGNPARALARYHSKTPQHALRYLGLITRAIDRRRVTCDESPQVCDDRRISRQTLRGK